METTNPVNTKQKPRFCPGCGHTTALYSLGKIISEKNLNQEIIFGVDIGCSLLAWDFFNLDTIQTHHGRTIPVIFGLKMAYPQKTCIAYLGDGGGYAIGAQHLVNSAVRNDPITVILINNANYGMTGGQQAPTTIQNQITETTPYGKKINHIVHGPEMVRALNKKAFVARAIATNPQELQNLLEEAITNQQENNTFSFLEIISPCLVNWSHQKISIPEFLAEMKNNFKTGKL